MTYVGKKQKTLIKSVDCSGIGLHTGHKINMTLRPAPIGTGIIFRRIDIDNSSEAQIKASYEAVTETNLGTTITNNYGHSVSTIEHLMSAIAAYGIDHMIIDIHGPEVPVMDGSAAPFLFILECAGIKTLSAPKKYLKITKTVRVTDGDKYAEISPSPSFFMEFDIDFQNKMIGKQSLNFEFSLNFFKIEIARARTFGFAEEVETLRKMGLARGGSVDNAIVIEDNKILNKNGLRYKDEFVRHKILDAVGDLALSGTPFLGKYKAYKSGHTLNNALLRKVFAEEAYLVSHAKPEEEKSAPSLAARTIQVA